MIRYPNITGKNDAQKLDQMKSYLHQLADELNYQLDKTSNIGSGYPYSSVDAGAVAKPVKKDDAISNFNEIKGLIIKSADIVNSYSEQISETLRGEYVAVSDFGTYTKETLADLEIGADEIRSSLTKVESIDDDIKNAVQSEIKQTADRITLEVDNGESTAAIKMKVGDRELDPATIDMKGLVTFSNLSTPNDKTVINGSNITTGQIKADRIKAGVLQSNDGESVVIDLDKGEGTFTGWFQTVEERVLDPDINQISRSRATMSPNSVKLYRKVILEDESGEEVFVDELVETHVTNGAFHAFKQTGGDVAYFGFNGLDLIKSGTWLKARVSWDRAYITGLTDPIEASDAVNKAYVDGNFAPTGYGLGAILPEVNHADNAVKPGFYFVRTGHPFDYGAATVLVTGGTGDIIPTQIAFGINMNPVNKNAIAVRTIADSGAWDGWEWVNPPLQPGVEYRTTERFQSRPVFVQCVNLTGKLPVAGATKFIPHGIANVEYPIDWYGVYANSQAFVPNANFNGIMVTGSQVYVAPSAGSGIGGSESLYVVIKYLKTGI